MLANALFKFEHVDTMPASDPIREAGVLCGDMFTGLVDILRSPSFPNPRINRLMTLVWRLVGNRIVNAAIMPGVEKLHFYIEKTGDKKIGFYACPMKWVQQAIDRPYYTQSGLVWASMCCDFFHDQIYSGRKLMLRAQAWEAEYILTQRQRDDYWLDDYQKSVMRRFPSGIDSARRMGLLYHRRKQYMGAS
jgi:hypothetical protein